MKALVLLLAACAAGAAPAPRRQTYIEYRLISPEIKAGTFAATPRKLWRSGARYLRSEEAPDAANRIHGLTIVDEPDVYMINRYQDFGRHIVDPGPTFNVHVPAFAGDPSAELARLELGREMEFFRGRKPVKLPDRLIDGEDCRVRRLRIGDDAVTLVSGKRSGLPRMLTIAGPGKSQSIEYLAYRVEPFDAALYAPPKDLKLVEESK